MRAAEFAQHQRLLCGLDPLRGYRHVQRFAESDDGLDDRSHRGIARHAANELSVDLDLGEGEAREIAQARIAGAEIVHSDVDAKIAKAIELTQHLLGVVDEKVLGDF